MVGSGVLNDDFNLTKAKYNSKETIKDSDFENGKEDEDDTPDHQLFSSVSNTTLTSHVPGSALTLLRPNSNNLPLNNSTNGSTSDAHLFDCDAALNMLDQIFGPMPQAGPSTIGQDLEFNFANYDMFGSTS
ncbi:hypothetical protein CY34DRAFT_14798 [Suillus luteus UH-Slu-Lm8-n1]|uniref:Uncharacterized protein n=1 Tax=Suillus luteus UH-Slu-Lm8-n1 TaxID=930992 RepID=A0A0D0AL07_9AGAM|nr:hypothetical protein CY34DRAFT_14798 [Suillus luteus UH-Slu-Lm8-n1]